MSRFVKAFIRLTLLVALLGVAFYVYATSPFVQGVVGLAIRIAAPKTADAATNNADTNVGAIPTQDYTVQPGDTPFGVALQYGTDVETLIALNKKKYPGIAAKPMQFNAGWVIRVPANGAGPVAAAEGGGQVALPTVASASGGGYFDYDAALEIVRLTNEERASVGVNGLAVDEGLMALARKRAMEIVIDPTHSGLADDCGDCGENLQAYRIVGADALFSRWLGSDGHKNNLLSSTHSLIGVGVYVYRNGIYAIQLFK